MGDVLKGFTFITHGGFMMVPLLLSLLLALAVIFERLFLFQARYTTSRETVLRIFEEVKGKSLKAAAASCANEQGPIADVLSAGIEHFQNPLEEMELAMKNRAEEWMPRLERRIEVIDTVITAAPLMGLLGTITGMMASFQVLSEKGVNEPNAITGGVAEALIATATGLVIALICLVAYNYLTARVKAFIYEIESMASRLVELRLATERAKN